MLHMSDLGLMCCYVSECYYKLVRYYKLLTMQLITYLLVDLGMTEFALVDYFVMGEAIGLVVSFYYSNKQMQKLSIDIETKIYWCDIFFPKIDFHLFFAQATRP